MGNVLSRCAIELSSVFRKCHSHKGDTEKKQVKTVLESQPHNDNETGASGIGRQQQIAVAEEDITEVHNGAQKYENRTFFNSQEPNCLPECDQILVNAKRESQPSEEPKISKEFIIQTYKIASQTNTSNSAPVEQGDESTSKNGANLVQLHGNHKAPIYCNSELQRTVDSGIANTHDQSSTKQSEHEKVDGLERDFLNKECEIKPTQARPETQVHHGCLCQSRNSCDCNKDITNYAMDCKDGFTQTHCVKRIETHIQTCEEESSQTNALKSGGEEQLPDRVLKLEKRQETVLQELQKLQQAVQSLAQQRGVSLTTTTNPLTGMASSSSSLQQRPLQDGALTDLVISADPSCVPLSLLVLLKLLSTQYQVLTSTFVHSSATDTPQNLRTFLQNGADVGARSNYQLSISIIWKKVPSGPRLMVSPTRQTYIEGEANIARYLSRVLQPAYDDGNIVVSTQIDEILDMVQQQLIQGNNKERSAVLRTLNARLGKGQWLVGSSLSVADMVTWSAVQGAKLVSEAPANVKKWLKVCAESQEFADAVKFLSS